MIKTTGYEDNSKAYNVSWVLTKFHEPSLVWAFMHNLMKQAAEIQTDQVKFEYNSHEEMSVKKMEQYLTEDKLKATALELFETYLSEMKQTVEIEIQKLKINSKITELKFSAQHENNHIVDISATLNLVKRIDQP